MGLLSRSQDNPSKGVNLIQIRSGEIVSVVTQSSSGNKNKYCKGKNSRVVSGADNPPQF